MNIKAEARTILAFVFIFISEYKSKSQNLVPNGSFESYSTCPSGLGQLFLASPWISPTLGLGEYFNTCATISSNASVPSNSFGNYQYAKTGNAYVGFGTYGGININSREYIQVKLDSVLKPCIDYSVTFYVTRHDSVSYAVSTIGAYFSSTAISRNDYSNFTYKPQINSDPTKPIVDTTNWVKISGTYNANGGEQYLTIGNFNDDLNTKLDSFPPYQNSSRPYAYYYLDDVSVTELANVRKPNAGNDASICKGTGVTIGTALDTAGIKVSWQPSVGLNSTVIPQPTATPVSTTTYTLTLTYNCGYTATAAVTVNVCDECAAEQDVYIPNIFSPNGDGKNDVLKIEGTGISNIYFAIYNRWGNLIFETYNQSRGWDGTQRGNPCEAGTYVYYFTGTCIKTNSEVNLKGNVSLIR